MKDEIIVSDDGCLLSKSIPAKTLKYEIDLSKIDFNNPVSKEDVANNYAFKTGGVTDKVENHFITDMYKYNKVKDGDRVFWYDNIGILSGSKGFVLIRDGYVWTTRAVWRS